jgi:uncharacterized repeat protein (TIGR01451 family)
VQWNICTAFSGGTCANGNPAFLGQSDFHLSCSDVDMNSADDCGKPAGNAKLGVACLPAGTAASCINDWIFEGMAGPAGSNPLICPDVAGGGLGSTTCEVSPQPYVCTKPIQELSMTWQGGAAPFDQPIYISAKVKSTGATVTLGPIAIGDTAVVNGYDGSLGNDVFWNIYSDAALTNQIGQSTFHLSCSDDNMDGPEDCGKTEGNAKESIGCLPAGTNASCVNLWTFEGMSGAGKTLDCANPGGAAAVTYIYEVTNNTAVPATGVMLTDAVTDSSGTTTVPVAGPFDLGPNETKTFEVVDSIGETTTDVATATACQLPFTSNQVTVNVPTTPGGGSSCPTGAASLTIKDRDVKWKLTDPKNEPKSKAEIESIVVNWPASNGVLKEVKLGSPRIFKGSLAPTSATITSFNGKANDRRIDDGKTEELKFKFENHVAAGPYDITVTFVGCPAIQIVKP